MLPRVSICHHLVLAARVMGEIPVSQYHRGEEGFHRSCHQDTLLHLRKEGGFHRSYHRDMLLHPHSVQGMRPVLGIPILLSHLHTQTAFIK